MEKVLETVLASVSHWLAWPAGFYSPGPQLLYLKNKGVNLGGLFCSEVVFLYLILPIQVWGLGLGLGSLNSVSW